MLKKLDFQLQQQQQQQRQQRQQQQQQQQQLEKSTSFELPNSHSAPRFLKILAASNKCWTFWVYVSQMLSYVE